MNNVLRYRGYLARVDLDADSMVFTGTLLGMAESIAFHGASIDELVADFRFAVDHYLAECEKSGRIPERPASGRLLLRLPPDLHAQAGVAAAADGVSLNQWISNAVASALQPVRDPAGKADAADKRAERSGSMR
ncbi:MAG: type II toxin-antitoxin system HicB family antitoxin [Betaproteobacteria bacterium]|nr:type II toxin-antitoxin system HicB family antitoxin [Betaproteobacteria bacterium]